MNKTKEERLKYELEQLMYDTVWNGVVNDYTAEQLTESVLEELGIKDMIKSNLVRIEDEMEATKDELREEIDGLKEEHGIDEDEFDTGIDEIDDLESSWDIAEENRTTAEFLQSDF